MKTEACLRCGTHVLADTVVNCPKCGAPWEPATKSDSLPLWQRQQPFSLAGYWCWPEVNFAADMVRIDVYEGTTWRTAFEFTRRVWDESVPEGTDGYDFLRNLLHAAMGETVTIPRGEYAQIVVHMHNINYPCKECGNP